MSSEQQWMVGLAQAQNFARRENYADAVVRVRGVVAEVRAAEATAGADERARVAAFRTRAEELLKSFERQFQAWNGGIAARRDERIENAEAEQKRPLPPLPR